MSDVLDLGHLLVQASFSYHIIKSISTAELVNEHGQLMLRLVLDGSQPSDFSKLEQSPVEVLDFEGKKVFCGICTNFKLEQFAQYAELLVTAQTQSYLADIEPKCRTFQDPGKTLKDILTPVLSPYGALLTFEQNPPVSQMIYQQNETDWAFARRIANQFGLSLFVNSKTSGFQVSVGVVPFSMDSSSDIPDDVIEKDISALRLHQQTTNPQLMAFEMERRGGPVANLSLGVGHCVQKNGRTFIVVKSAITSAFGTVYNNVTYTGMTGALPIPAQAPTEDEAPVGNTDVAQGRTPALHSSNVISGKVLDVSGSYVKVQFDVDKDGSGGTRWIPYASYLSDCVYVMPDIGDTVFCYFENDGTFVCLGSKHVDITRDDFLRPEEKVLTSKNRMIKFKGAELDITGCRSEMDGKGGMQLRVVLSDEEGIEIAATKDVYFKADKSIYIQGLVQDADNPQKTQEILQEQGVQASNFLSAETAGSNYHTAHGGAPSDPSVVEAGIEAIGAVGGAIFNEIASPVNTFLSWFAPPAPSGGGEGEKDENDIEFEDVETQEVAIFGLNCCMLQVQECYLMIDNANIFAQCTEFHQLGFFRGRTYDLLQENTNTFLDNLLDGVQLALDIVGIVGSLCAPLNVVASAANAAISFCRGDYAGAAANLLGCIPGGSALGFAGKVLGKTQKFKKVLVALEWFGKISDFIDNVQLVVGAQDALYSIGTFFSVVFSEASGQEKWDATYNMLNNLKGYIGPAMKAADALKPKSGDAPDGPENRPTDDGDSDGAGTKKPQPPDTDAPEVPQEKQSSCGDPIDMVTGSQRIRNTDFIVKEIGEDFRLVRVYESCYENKGGILGSRWFLNIETRVWVDGEAATVVLPDMHLEHFDRTEDGNWRNNKTGNGTYQLKETDAGFCLHMVKERKQYQYDAAGNLLMITDRNNNRVWLRYLGSTLQRMEFSSGQVLEFAYEQGKLASITDVIGRKICYTYDGELLTSARLADEGTIHYAYTPEGWLTSVIDQNGNQYVRNEYDFSGRVTRQFLATGEEFVVLYDDSNRTTIFQTVGKDDRTFFHYNNDGLVERTVYPDGTSEDVRFDENQNVIWERDRNGGELHRVYDEDSQLLEERLPNGLVVNYAYDESGNLIRQWDNSGRDTSYSYDKYGNRTEMRVVLGGNQYSVYQFLYDTHGRVSEIIDPNGNTLRYSYEGMSPDPAVVTLSDGRTIQYSYDRAGRCMSVRNEFGERRYSYNNLDFMCLMIDPMGHHTSWEFDRLGNLIRFLMPNQYDHASDDQMGTHYHYDAMDKLVATVDAVGSVLATPRDLYGNIHKEINPNTYDPITRDGEGIVYDYDAEDRRIRIRYPDGGVERIFYDANGNIIKKVQPTDYDPVADDGPGYTYEYDEVNRLVQITAPNGVVEKRYVYNLRGDIVKLIDAAGYLAGDSDETRIGTLYRYNPAGWLMEKREPVDKGSDGTIRYRLTEYRHDRAGNVIEERRYQDSQTAESAAGPVLSIFFAYDKNNRLVQVSDSTGAAVEYGYNSINQRTKEKRRLSDGLYQIFLWKYDAAGRMVEQSSSIDRPDGGQGFATTTYSYDKSGNITRIQTATGGEILREYDAVDRLIAETHREKASGIHNRTLFSYDKAGNLVGITDSLGRQTVIEYDLLNREIRRIEKDGSVTRSFYDGNGRLSKVVRPNQYNAQADDGAGYQYTYDHRGQVLTVIGPDGHVLQTNTYDADGRLLQQLDGLQSGAEFHYDLAGNRVKIKTSGGATQELEYDARGNIVGVVDGNQNRTTYRLDNWGRIIGIVKADGSTEFYSYDCAGNMVSSTDGEGHTTLYEYGRAGKLTAIQDPTGERELYSYDAEGRLVRKTDRNGVTVEFGYNLYGAPLFKKVKDGALGDFYEYTPEGLLKCAISAGMRYVYEYDALDRMIRKSASGRTLLALAYDGNGNKIRQTDVAGKVTEFVYSPLDLLTEVWDDGHRLAAYEYNADGTIRAESHGPIQRQFQYDLDKNLTGLLVQSGGELLAENQYLYDGNGNRTLKRQLGGDTLYHYDPLNQLKKVEYPSYTEELFYDKAGNRTRRIASGVEELYQYDPRNRLTAFTKGGVTTMFQYDHAGNLLADDKARYSYDAFNRTEKVETFDGHIQLNRYDAEGLRYEMEENGNLVQFIFNQNREVVTEEDTSSLNRLIRGTELIAASSSADSARTYYHYVSDEMGSTTHIVDEAGAVQNRYEYDAWGNITAQEEAVSNRFKFTGQQWDPVTQQYYLRARFYNPVIAKFTQEDTYRGDGLNLYVYCANNPVFYEDPSGFRKSKCYKDAYEKYVYILTQQYIDKGYSEKKAKKLAKKNHKDEIRTAANAIVEENRRGSVWKDGSQFPDRTLNAQMEAQYVAAVMNRLEYYGKIEPKMYGAVTVLTHSDGSVSVGFSTEHLEAYAENTNVAYVLHKELIRLNNERHAQGVNYSKEYAVSGIGMPLNRLDNCPGAALQLNRCAEPKAMETAHSNKYAITGGDTVWRGGPNEKGEIPHSTDEFRDPRLIYVYAQMEPCTQCQHNVTNYYEYATES